MSRYSYRKHEFDFGDFEITKREILASISIIAAMLLIGVLISSKISEHQLDANEVYNKAVKIDNADLFQYGMDTNVGNAFVYGDLVAVDTVTYPEIGGEYMSVKKETEEYTRHTKTVYEYDEDGNVTGSHEEEYWTWDEIRNDSIDCKKVTFLGIEFNYGQIYKPSKSYIETIYDRFDSDIRYVYYGAETNYTGTIFTDLREQTISDNTQFYNNKNIKETVKYLESGDGVIIFWIFWIVLICGCVFGFYYLDNKWLEYKEGNGDLIIEREVVYIAELDTDVDDVIAAEYLHNKGVLKEVVCDPLPRTPEGKNRKEQLEKLGIKVSNKMPPIAKYVFVGGALTELARYLINHKIECLVVNGGFVGCNIVRNPLDKFNDKQVIRTFNFNCDVTAADSVLKSKNIENVILVGKNVCHSEKNTLLGVWGNEKKLLEKYHSKPGKRQHDMLACREGLIMLGMLDEKSYLDYKIVRPYNTGLKGNMTEWGSTFGKSPYKSVMAAVGWR